MVMASQDGGKATGFRGLKLPITLEGAYSVSRRNLIRRYLKFFLLFIYVYLFM